MIVSVNITKKAFGINILYEDLQFDIQDNEKIALIGRNGTGKTTLLHILSGDDADYDGEITRKKGSIIVTSRQEHHQYENMLVLDYILDDLPEYKTLHSIITTYPASMGNNTRKIQEYSDALERFSQLGYFEAESDITELLKSYQLSEQAIASKVGQLSGGQKRLVELAKVQRSRAHLAVIDEPTNHMDYIAKKAFIKWFKAAKEAVLVITHDRDLLREVDKIIEIKDSRAHIFNGNYDDYLRTNATKTVSAVHEYSVTQRRIANLKENVIRFRRLKEKSRDPGTIQRFKGLEIKAQTELSKLENIEAPSFWIDRESVDNLNEKVSQNYEKHKAKNIKVRTSTSNESLQRLLIDVTKLSLGYDQTPLFSDISFQVREGDTLRLHGRNGVGKSTLINAVVAQAKAVPLACKKLAGTIAAERELRIGIYEQEIPAHYLDMTLGQAIENAYMAKDLKINDTKAKQLLGDYLFNPMTDADTPIQRLSGGQKARFQLINMLAGNPQILILDEPTNHLDLPSIEELEDALAEYSGAILFISHDSYFAKNINSTQEILLKA